MLRVLSVLHLLHHVYIRSILISVQQIHSHLLLVCKLHFGLCYPSLETIKDAILTRGSHICCCIILLLLIWLSPVIDFSILWSMLLTLRHAPAVVDKLALDKFPLGWYVQRFCCTTVELLLRILVLVRLFDLCYVGHCDSAADWIQPVFEVRGLVWCSVRRPLSNVFFSGNCCTWLLTLVIFSLSLRWDLRARRPELHLFCFPYCLKMSTYLHRLMRNASTDAYSFGSGRLGWHLFCTATAIWRLLDPWSLYLETGYSKLNFILAILLLYHLEFEWVCLWGLLDILWRFCCTLELLEMINFEAYNFLVRILRVLYL